MRCPSCGNENPDDYTFCDECGAKLTPTAGDAIATGPAPDVIYAPAAGTSAQVSAPLSPPPMASPMPMDPTGGAQAVAMSSQPLGGVCPNCGATTVPGEAYCNECGAELATATSFTPPGDGAPSHMEPYMGNSEVTEESGSVSVGVPVAAISMQETPVTEDTMPSEMPLFEMPQADFTQAASMPGIMPIPIEADEATGASPVVAMDESVPIFEPMPAPMITPAAAPQAAMDTAYGSTAAWATDALRQLDEAQQSMSKGDWVAYGQSINALKAFLENVIKGTAPQVSGMDVTAAPVLSQPTVDEGAADSRLAQPAVSVPAVDMPLPPAPAPPSLSPMISGTATSVATGLSRLVVIATGAELPLPQQEEITVGREDPSSGIFPDIDLTPYGGEDGGVSRRHARLLHIGNEYYVEDLQSTNYTKIDGQRLPARVREKLEDGARLDFGRVAMIFRRG